MLRRLGLRDWRAQRLLPPSAHGESTRGEGARGESARGVPPRGQPRAALEVTAAVPLLADHPLPAATRSCCSRKRPLDQILGTGSGQWIALFVIGVLLVVSGQIVWLAVGGDDDVHPTEEESFWYSWYIFFDPGTQTGLNPSDAMSRKLIVAAFSTAGFLFNLAVLGKVVDLIREQLQFWQQTRSRVWARGHTVMLGWGENSLFLLMELLHAYEQKAAARCGCRFSWMRRHVVVVAEKPAFELEQHVQLELGEQNISAHGIHFREGNPADRQELIRAAAGTAGDVIVMGTRPSATSSDQEVLRVIMALAALPKGHSVTGEVFAEVRQNQNMHVVQEILPLADGIVARQAVNRMLCLCSLVPAVGRCYLELMSFRAGNQLFLEPAPVGLWGVHFAEACRTFPNAVVLGLAKASGEGGGAFHNPSSALVPDGMQQTIQRGDSLVLLAQSSDMDASGQSSSSSTAPATGRAFGVKSTPKIQRKPTSVVGSGAKVVVIVGCPLDLADLLGIMDLYLAKGSTVHVLSESPITQREQNLKVALLASDGMDSSSCACSLFCNLQLQHYVGPTTSRLHLTMLPLQKADCVIILDERQASEDSTAEADSRNLTTMINLQSLPQGQGVQPHCTVLCELLDRESDKVVNDTGLKAHGIFFCSSSLEAAVFAMAAECKAIYNILMLLLQPQSQAGDIVLVSVTEFVNGNETLSFFDLHAKVWEAYEGVLIGWRRDSMDPVMNPSDKAEPLSWQRHRDLLIIMLKVAGRVGTPAE